MPVALLTSYPSCWQGPWSHGLGSCTRSHPSPVPSGHVLVVAKYGLTLCLSIPALACVNVAPSCAGTDSSLCSFLQPPVSSWHHKELHLLPFLWWHTCPQAHCLTGWLPMSQLKLDGAEWWWPTISRQDFPGSLLRLGGVWCHRLWLNTLPDAVMTFSSPVASSEVLARCGQTDQQTSFVLVCCPSIARWPCLITGHCLQQPGLFPHTVRFSVKSTLCSCIFFNQSKTGAWLPRARPWSHTVVSPLLRGAGGRTPTLGCARSMDLP